MKTAAVNAPELNTSYGWVNTLKPYTIKDVKGKIVLLDFFTFGCINCQHILPDLKRLEEEYAGELVIIGVHSGKFRAEKDSRHIQEALLKLGIQHPVINDAEHQLWDAFAVRAWPTVVLISPNGKVVGQHAGEGVYKVTKPYLDLLKTEYKDSISKSPISFQLRIPDTSPSKLRFPSKLITGSENTLFCADSGHHRILQLTTEGEIIAVIGQGTAGFSNGSFEKCTFFEPHGMALHRNLLYIADTKNNALRVADLIKKTVTTVAGTGELDYYFFYDRLHEPVLPNSPWDLLIHQNALYIASAGNHQILKMDLEEKIVKRFAGSGREGLANGGLQEAAFSQPSGLSLMDNTLFVADPEASAVRAIDLQQNIVYTPLGSGLFDFGDIDGSVEDALLQHNMGLTAHSNMVYIADTYNGKIKQLDLHKERVKTVLSGLSEPNDLLFLQNELWISNTHQHQLLRVNLKTMHKKVVDIRYRN